MRPPATRASVAPTRSRAAREPGRDAFLAPVVLAGIVACALLAAILVEDDAPMTPEIPTRAVATGGRPTAIAVAGDRLWMLETGPRRLRSVSRGAPSEVGGPLVVSGPGTVATDIAPDGDGVWVAVARTGSGGGRVIRIDRAGRDRSLGRDDIAPQRIAVLPAAVVALGPSRLASISRSGRAGWTRPVPGAVDVAVGYGSIWTVSRAAGGSLLRRWSTAGRLAGRRWFPGAVTALAVGNGAVWLANGCAGGVARAPVGAGPAMCRRTGSSFSDVAVGAGGTWAADVDGGRIVRLAPATGAAEAATHVPGRPGEVAAGPGGAWALTRHAGVFLLAARPGSHGA